MSGRILVVEDDRKLGPVLVRGFATDSIAARLAPPKKAEDAEAATTKLFVSQHMNLTGDLLMELVGTNGIQHMLAGNGNSVPVGAGASFGGAGGIGSSIAQSVNGALAPLGAALGAMK